MLISLSGLVSVCEIQKNFYSKMRLISIHMKKSAAIMKEVYS